jgi:F0F1-type ATP synthase epsilon subunit
MKSTAVNVGSVNLRGKKSKVLACKCCVAADLREKEFRKRADKAMRMLDELEDNAAPSPPAQITG